MSGPGVCSRGCGLDQVAAAAAAWTRWQPRCGLDQVSRPSAPVLVAWLAARAMYPMTIGSEPGVLRFCSGGRAGRIIDGAGLGPEAQATEEADDGQ